MKTLVSPNFVLQEVTQNDLIVASLAWGFTLGFGWLTVWTAMKQSAQVYQRRGRRVFRNTYAWMIWGEIAVCLAFAIICYLHLLGVIQPSFAFYFAILTTWALQVQFLLQIIVNRCSILMTDDRKALRLKIGVAVLITAINISVYCIWLPARLEISRRFIWINSWWDRCEKVLYLIVDASLNLYFIHIVRANLILHGLTKYRKLVHFNMFIIGFSLSMDVLIISMMSLKNTFVYMQFHPLAYIVKLNIEMSMAELIGKIASNRNCGLISEGTLSYSFGEEGLNLDDTSVAERRRSTITANSAQAPSLPTKLRPFPDRATTNSTTFQTLGTSRPTSFAMRSSYMRITMRLLLAFCVPLSAPALSESPLVYPSPQGKGHGAWADAYASAEALVGQMTLLEKVNITRGFDSDNVCAGNTGAVPRLGWPGMCLHDAGNGVRATDLVNSYPSGIHVGASWDKKLTYQRGFYMGQEFKAKGVNVPLGPNAGPLGRTPLGGRNWEGFSVDPYLSGKLNAETIKGYQDAGVIANLKHFIGNEQETLRRPYFGVEAASSNIDDKTLHEFYLWPFMDGVRAGAGSIMCSYNRINNTYGCENSKLMNGILKTELSFEGFVVLDWNAQHDVNSANAGLDMVMPLGGNWGDNLTAAVNNGSVSENRINDMATRILAAWYLVGQDSDFPVPGIGMRNLTEPHELVDARVPESRPVIIEGAIAGHVLVKNINQALPLKHNLTMISVFGYDAMPPSEKNTDSLFQLGYTSSPEMDQAVLGTENHFDQAAKGGTIVTGGRAGANGPSYIRDPLSAIQQTAALDGTWVNWDLTSFDPDVNAAPHPCLVFINAMATEGWDRDGLHDDFSDGLILNVASKCANTIVVIHAAGIRLVDQWIEHPNITAVIVAHLPGQDSGTALVKLLYGDASFSGKLPYTLARNESDYSVYAPCKRAHDDLNPQCDYEEGVYVDYRDFDAKNITPRYEFGYGLSYTAFHYDSISVAHMVLPGASSGGQGLWDSAATVTARVINNCTVTGLETAQLYLAIPNSPPKQLRGFEKVSLLPKESALVKFELTRRDFSIWDVVAQQWLIQEGNYTVFVGASSRDIRLTEVLQVEHSVHCQLQRLEATISNANYAVVLELDTNMGTGLSQHVPLLSRMYSRRLLCHVVSAGVLSRAGRGSHHGNIKFVLPPQHAISLGGNLNVAYHPFPSKVASGLSTSMLLETVLLRLGRDGLSWPAAAKTAAGMSFISMLTMEMAQNAVDYHLTGGAVAFDSPAFWLAAVVSMSAGFLTPLPYNYLRLRKYGKACH
ncbi:hypothetical protein G7046_g5332 [Stylonectria norvegica]|nr:hypothetical protein G7046_g5332 [Stylonectria norvegica]